VKKRKGGGARHLTGTVTHNGEDGHVPEPPKNHIVIDKDHGPLIGPTIVIDTTETTEKIDAQGPESAITDELMT
jgi:hypothetical protein